MAVFQYPLYYRFGRAVLIEQPPAKGDSQTRQPPYGTTWDASRISPPKGAGQQKYNGPLGRMISQRAVSLHRRILPTGIATPPEDLSPENPVQ